MLESLSLLAGSGSGFTCKTVAFVPVSYTHLDVYKRQQQLSIYNVYKMSTVIKLPNN